MLACSIAVIWREWINPAPVFVTEYGTGPDKWATAWFLTRYQFPGAELRILDGDRQPSPGIEFDTARSQIRRSANRSSFEVALYAHAESDPVLQRLASAIHDIEVNYWAAPTSADATIIDQAYRTVHRRLADLPVDRPGNRPTGPPSDSKCYLAFFDAVFQALQKSEQLGHPLTLDDISPDCVPKAPAKPQSRRLVEEIPIDRILGAIAANKRVTFIDVRESSEYHEAHIPGAINLKLRDVTEASIQPFRHDDYVVAYCVKDFRGFEMAKLLKLSGVENAVILNPFGIQGWIAEGLPVAGENGLRPEQAVSWLEQCRSGRSGCSETEAGP